MAAGWRNTSVNFDNISSFNDIANNPGRLFARAIENADFRLLFADLVHKHMFNDGVLTPDVAQTIWDDLANQVNRAVIPESARWGDVLGGAPKTYQDWLDQQQWMDEVWFPQRTDIVLDQLRANGLYSNVDAPEFEINGVRQHGGDMAMGDLLNISDLNVPNGGIIYYTLDGTDPRQGAGGFVSPLALEFTTPFELDQSTLVKSRIKQGSTWSALTEAVFTPPFSARGVVMTEINYNPHAPTQAELSVLPGIDGDEFEFIEFHNAHSTDVVNLAGMALSGGVTFAFPNVDLAAGDYAIIVENTTAFQLRYGTSITVLGEWSGKLSDAGEALVLTDGLGVEQFNFVYGDDEPWPEQADGFGATLELIDVDGTSPDRIDEYYSWRASREFGGSPGEPGLGPIGVVINEVLTNPSAGSEQLDAIELLNTTSTAIDLSGWSLSNSDMDLFKFSIGNGTVLAPGEYLVYDENDFNASGGASPDDFELDGDLGDAVWLVAGDETNGVQSIMDVVMFGGANLDESLNRSASGTGRLVPASHTTLGCGNSQTRVGPLVISEFHYHPKSPNTAALAIEPFLTENDTEFVEIHNPTTDTIDLEQWRIRGGVEYDFISSVLLAPGESIVVISLEPDDPGNADRVAAFRVQFGIDPTVRLVGGWTGNLSNNDEEIRLERPTAPPPGNPTLTPYVVEDGVLYDDEAPWAIAADGRSCGLLRHSRETQRPTGWRPSRLREVLIFRAECWVISRAMDWSTVPISIGCRIKFAMAVTFRFTIWMAASLWIKPTWITWSRTSWRPTSATPTWMERSMHWISMYGTRIIFSPARIGAQRTLTAMEKQIFATSIFGIKTSFSVFRRRDRRCRGHHGRLWRTASRSRA